MVDLLDGLDQNVQAGDHVRVGVVRAVLQFGNEVDQFVYVLLYLLAGLAQL